MSRVKRILWLSITFEVALLVCLVLGIEGLLPAMPRNAFAMAATAVGIFVSNVASSKIVGYVIANCLWPRLDTKRAHQDSTENPSSLANVKLSSVKGKSESMTWHHYWVHLHRGSPLTHYLGFGERVLLFLAGLHSLSAFFAVAGAWTTIKLAADWSIFKELPHRGIGHIYLLGCLFSMLFSLLDVVVVRLLFDLSLGLN